MCTNLKIVFKTEACKTLSTERRRTISYINLGDCCNTLSTTLVALPLGAGAYDDAGHTERAREVPLTDKQTTLRINMWTE